MLPNLAVQHVDVEHFPHRMHINVGCTIFCEYGWMDGGNIVLKDY
jgi:hypothetical protein